MLSHRTARAAVAALALAGAITLAGCTGTGVAPTTTTATATPTPTPTAPATATPPTDDQDAAIAAADAVLTEWFQTRGEVNAAGGTDTAPLEALATGRALQVTLSDASRVANGPANNEDGVSVDGPLTTTGQITYETIAAYGQDYQGIPNGLVTIHACQDASGYMIKTADGKPAQRPEQLRNTFDFQVIYDADRSQWLVSDIIDTGETC